MLVGRDTELQAVRDVLAAISGPIGIVLEGEAGIGKTAVWRAGLAEAEDRQRVASTRRSGTPTKGSAGLAGRGAGDPG